ncbi:nitroreductase [Streptomyces sp. ISL-98]|uniref:nitroreductase n=1 Tax=Streptomyces sp. ISL-98 TaxID=2819192 RepID=UPI001BEB62CA|nr:nitroreductase [Streptomyces sp. ISL-98]MBT2510365.1 nitroreductase [Streptomyces sp. ISL-98]
MTPERFTNGTAHAALARARSLAAPGPDTAAGSAPVWPSPPQAITGEIDGVLRHALAAADGANGRLRPVPSAGALHPVDAHLLVGRAGPLPPGRYAYDARTHRVHHRGPAPDDPPDGTLAVLTVTARRTVSHYGHRALPLLLLDAGHAAAALALAGAAQVCLDADGALLSAAAGLPNSRRWQETWPGTEPQHPLAAVTVTPTAEDPQRALERWASCGSGAAPHAVPSAGRGAAVLDETRRALDDVTLSGGGPGQWAPAAQTVPRSLALSRRSAPPPLRGEPVREDLARVLARAAGAWPGGPRWCVAVGGARPVLLELAPGTDDIPVLRQLASGDARPALASWAAGQGWIAEAGAVLLAHGCPTGADPARIRRDHLAAGYGVGLAQTAATGLGLRSRPVGSWQQADLGAALGGERGRDWILHGLALGRGDERSRAFPEDNPQTPGRAESSAGRPAPSSRGEFH